MSEKTRSLYSPVADILRVLAILAVIMIHTSGRTLEAASYDLRRVPWTLFLNQATRFAVPMFFMLSGFVLELSHRTDLNFLKFIWRRLNKIAIPYVTWSIVYYLYVYKQHTQGFPETLVYGSASYQLYFIPTLIIFYLVFPLIHRVYKLISSAYCLVPLGILQLWILWQCYYVQPPEISFPIAIALLNFYAFLVGIVAARNQETILKFASRWKLVIGFLVVGFLYVVYTEGLNIYLRTHNYLAFTSQWRPSVLLYTFSFSALVYYFLTKKLSPELELKLEPIVKTLSKLSFFVFFVHIIFLEVIWERFFLPGVLASQTHILELWWFDPAFFGAVTLASFGTAFLVHKIPWANKVTG